MTQGPQSYQRNVEKVIKYANVFPNMTMTATAMIYRGISFQFGDK